MDGFNFDQLRAFCDVVELGSFSAAARRRNLTQPAVSLRIKQLERRLGVRLIERSGRRVRATPVGSILYEQARNIDRAVSTAVEAIADHQGDIGGRVVIAAGSTASVYLLPPILGALKQTHPRLEFIVRTASTSDIMNWIDDNLIDIAVVSRPPDAPNLQATTIHVDELVAIAPSDDILRPPEITAARLAEKPLIMLPAGGGARVVVDPWFEAAGFACRPIMELGSVEAIKRMVKARLGYSVVPRLSVAGEPPGSIGIHSLFPRIYRELALVMRQDKHVSRALREVCRALEALNARPFRA